MNPRAKRNKTELKEKLTYMTFKTSSKFKIEI